MTRKPFAFRPGEPRNRFAWLGVAPLVMAKRFPVVWFGVVLYRIDEEDHDDKLLLETARRCEDGRCTPEWQWRRVLLPMLLEEAKKRGIDV